MEKLYKIYDKPIWVRTTDNKLIWAVDCDDVKREFLGWSFEKEALQECQNWHAISHLRYGEFTPKEGLTKRWYPATIFEKFDQKKPPMKLPEVEIYRPVADRSVHYGDGGFSNLVYPLWICDELPIQSDIRTEVVHDLDQLAQARQDFQENGVVEDIIDPDLYPYLTPNNTLKLHKTKFLKYATEQYKKTKWTPSKIEDEWKTLNEISPTESDDIRYKYQWIPTEILFKSDGTVNILSRIHNLPRTPTTRKLYENIEKILEKMAPMYAQLDLLPKGKDTVLQIVIKAQRYHIQPSMTYAGRWHTEGKSENIVAVGVYYCEIGEGLEGGSLKFRPQDAPQPYYDIETDVEVSVKEGGAVVFSNSLPHRFRMMKNTSNSTQRRTFLNFFVVNPDLPLKSTREVPSSVDIHYILQRRVATTLNRVLPSPIIAHIMSYANLWGSKEEAVRYRKRSRESMKGIKSGWGWINWGNCGTVEFVPCFNAWDPYRQEEAGGLNSTNSEG